jgi:hypothetical protein
MTNRSDNRSFLLPGVNTAKQIDRAILDLDSQSLGFAIGAALEGVLNLFAQFFRVHFSRQNSDFVNYTDDTIQP